MEEAVGGSLRGLLSVPKLLPLSGTGGFFNFSLREKDCASGIEAHIDVDPDVVLTCDTSVFLFFLTVGLPVPNSTAHYYRGTGL